jgi:hypothetical protein
MAHGPHVTLVPKTPPNGPKTYPGTPHLEPRVSISHCIDADSAYYRVAVYEPWMQYQQIPNAMG